VGCFPIVPFVYVLSKVLKPLVSLERAIDKKRGNPPPIEMPGRDPQLSGVWDAFVFGVTLQGYDEAMRRAGPEHGCSAKHPLDSSPPVSPQPTVYPVYEEREDTLAVALLDPDVREGHQRYLEQQTRRPTRERE